MDQPDNLGGLSPNSPSVALCVASLLPSQIHVIREICSHESHRQEETFCGMMGMLPPVSQRAYTTQNQKLFVASGDVREASFADAAAELRKDVPEDQVLDITVTCDGTLARRGFQSLYGIVVVVSWKSGKVLDVEVLSKHCQA